MIQNYDSSQVKLLYLEGADQTTVQKTQTRSPVIVLEVPALPHVTKRFDYHSGIQFR